MPDESEASQAGGPPRRSRDGRMWWRASSDLSRHPKLLALPPKVRWMWVDAMCHASRYLTDGFVSDANASQIGTDFRTLSERKRAWDLLVFAGLVERVARPLPGYQLHDYLEHQVGREQVEQLRQRRADAGRKGGQAKAKRVATATAVAKQTLEQTPSDGDREIEERQVLGPPARPVRGRSLPPDFRPSMRDLEYARQHTPGVDSALITREFVEFYRTRPHVRRADWHEEWRTWMHRSTTPKAKPAQPAPDTSRLTREECDAILGRDSWTLSRNEYPGDPDDLAAYNAWLKAQVDGRLALRRQQAAEYLAAHPS